MTLAREVRRLAAPAIATSLLQTAVFLVDRVMLGRHAAVDLAAIHIAGNVEWSVFAVGTAFTVGTLARVGMASGGGDRRAIRAATLVSLGVAALLGLIVAASLVPALPLLGRALPNASEAVIEGATGYLRATFLAAPAMLLAAAMTAALQGSGDTRTPLAVSVLVNVVHVGSNAVLIGGGLGLPALGARGAGISTAICFALEAALLAVALLRRGGLLGGPPAGARAVLRTELAETGRIAWPAIAERAVLHVGFLVYTWIIALLGDAAMAANQTLISIEAICFLTADGFGVAAAALVAKKVGAARPDEARAAAAYATRAAALVLLAFAVAIVLLRGPLPFAFTSDGGVAAQARAVIPILALAQPFMATGIVLSQAVRGAGATREALAVSFAGSVLVRVPACWLLAVAGHWGLTGVWIGSTLDWAVRAVTLALVARISGPRLLDRAVRRYEASRARMA